MYGVALVCIENEKLGGTLEGGNRLTTSSEYSEKGRKRAEW